MQYLKKLKCTFKNKEDEAIDVIKAHSFLYYIYTLFYIVF